jgi:hypothetical protein
MDSRMTVEIEGAASAQLIRPDVAHAQWLASPFAVWAWRVCRRTAGQGFVEHELVFGEIDEGAVIFVEQLPDFDAWAPPVAAWRSGGRRNHAQRFHHPVRALHRPDDVGGLP